MASDKKSVRLLDGDIVLYPRVLVADLVKTSTIGETGTVTETLFKPVEQMSKTSDIYAYGHAGSASGGSDVEVKIAFEADSIPLYKTAAAVTYLYGGTTAGDNQSYVNIQYANDTYGRLGIGNHWYQENYFVAGLSIGDNDAERMRLKMNGASPEFNLYNSVANLVNTITVPYKTGTMALDIDVSAAKTDAITQSKAYTDTQINAKIKNAYIYKGTKPTYADLPATGNVAGDVWNVEAKYGNYPAGTNWAWNGTSWDPLGGSVDLTNYVTATTAFTLGDKFVTTSGVGRNIKQSDYGVASSVTNTTTYLPTAAAVYEFVNSKLSGSIWDASKVVYGDGLSDAEFGNGLILVSKKDSSGHYIAEEKYSVSSTVVNGQNYIASSIAVYNALANKVDKITTANSIYVVNSSGAQSSIKYGTAATANQFPIRDTAGQLIVPVTPTASAHATSKSYVDGKISAIQNSMISYEEVS